MAEARRLLVDFCRGMPVEHVDVARLLLSELVMNALQHGAGDLTLVLAREGRFLRVEVHDEGRVMPTLTESPSFLERGWGLQVVAASASSWGALPNEDGQPGKQVWFELS